MTAVPADTNFLTRLPVRHAGARVVDHTRDFVPRHTWVHKARPAAFLGEHTISKSAPAFAICATFIFAIAVSSDAQCGAFLPLDTPTGALHAPGLAGPSHMASRASMATFGTMRPTPIAKMMVIAVMPSAIVALKRAKVVFTS